jgi:hypothetical protein
MAVYGFGVHRVDGIGDLLTWIEYFETVGA